MLGDIWRGVEACRPGYLAEAKRYHRDFGLSTWVQDQNEKKAVAPTPQIIIRRLQAMAAAGSLSPNVHLCAWMRCGLRQSGNGVGGIGGVCGSSPMGRGNTCLGRKRRRRRGARFLSEVCASWRERGRGGAAKGGPPGGPHFGDRFRVVLFFCLVSVHTGPVFRPPFFTRFPPKHVSWRSRGAECVAVVELL